MTDAMAENVPIIRREELFPLRLTADFSLTLTLADGDTTAVISISPSGSGRERTIILRRVKAILSEMGLSRRLWTRPTLMRMVEHMKRECPGSVISWVDVPGGAALRGRHPRQKPGVIGSILNAPAIR